jgi:hypothetical protein
MTGFSFFRISASRSPAPAAADVVQLAVIVIEPEQQVLDMAAIVLVDPADHASIDFQSLNFCIARLPGW